jgi:type VI secretion system protein ImpA
MPDLDRLLAPIRVGAPTGDDLRLSSGDLTFQKIGELRSEIDPQLDPGGTGRAADWTAMVRECEEALRTKSKDLQIAAWLTEGWSRRDGFAGLRDGLTLVRELSYAYWDALHPGCDEGQIDPGVRARPLSWLGSSRDMLRSLKACPLMKLDAETFLSWEHHELSRLVDHESLSTDHGRYQEMLNAGWIGGDEWRRRLRDQPLSALRETHANVESCLVLVEELRKLASERFADADAPNLIPLTNLLNEIREHLASYLAPPALESAPTAEATASGTSPSAQGSMAGPIRSREQALRMLVEVADWYRKNEPHSPIAPLVARAARWGSLPFEQVLREVVQDEGVLTRVWEMLGIRPESSGS